MAGAFEELLPYFRRAEDNVRGESELHGAGGPLSVEDGSARTPMAGLFIEAAARRRDTSPTRTSTAPPQDGVGRYQVTHRRGARGASPSHTCTRRAPAT